jgi:hypothetical protein
MVMSIDDADGHAKAVRLSIPVRTFEPKDKPTLIFHRYGDQYFLYQVWAPGETTGRQFLTSRTEREIQQSLPAGPSSAKVAQKMEPETVTIAGDRVGW